MSAARALLALAALSWAAPAFGQSSYQPFVLGLRTGGMGGAGVAFGDDSAMPWLNPAGIGRTATDAFFLSANAYMQEQLLANDYIALSPATASEYGISAANSTSKMSSSESSVFPTSLMYVAHFGADGRHVLAFSFLTPYLRTFGADAHLQWNMGSMTDDLRELRNERVTSYDVGPSYAYVAGPLTLGVSAFVNAMHLEREYSTDGTLWSLSQHQIVYSTSNATLDASHYALDLVAGVQYGPVAGGLHAGLSVRAPSIHLGGSMKLYSRGYYASSAAAEADMNYARADVGNFLVRRPLSIALGLGYQRPDSFALALDVTYYLPVSQYTQFSGSWETLAISNDPAVPASFGSEPLVGKGERVAVINYNLGGELYLTHRIGLRGGAFTDFTNTTDLPSLQDRTGGDIGSMRVNRFGGTLGVLYRGDQSQFQLAFVFVGGVGDIVTLQASSSAMSYPSRDLAYNTYMITFSGKMEAQEVASAVKGAVIEEATRPGN